LPDNDKPDYHVTVSFGVTDDIVTSVQVESQMVGKSSESVEHFAQDWRSYTWEQIMTQYGRPSQVVFVTDPPVERDAPGYYGVTLIYEPLGFAVGYMGLAQLTADFSTMRACPVFNEVLLINLDLVSPEDSVTTHLHKLMGTYKWPLLEEETGMSVDVFYETFKEADSDVCLEQRIVAP
jgi:hypothetical protein